jgi:FtsH-binding integral membrane protein
MASNDRATNSAQAQALRRYKRGALTALAACLLVAAFLCAATLLFHVQRDQAQGARLWPGDDHFESGLVFAWFVAGVLAMFVSNSLRSPVRQFVFACAAMMTVLAMAFCLVAAAG